HRGVIGSPDPRNELRFARDRHVTRRRPADEREPLLEGLGRRRHAVVDAATGRRSPPVELRAEHAEAARVRVDDRDADVRAGREPELLRRSLCEASDALAHRPYVRADARELVGREIAEADRIEVALVPTTFLAEVRPFAHGRAERSHLAAG